MKTIEQKLKQVKEILHYWGEDDESTLESIIVKPNGIICIDSVQLSGFFIADLLEHGYRCSLFASISISGYIKLFIE